MFKGILSSDECWQHRLSAINPPVLTLEDFLTRDIVQLSCAVGCSIRDIEQLKMQVGETLLFRSQQPQQQQQSTAADWLSTSVPISSPFITPLTNRKSGWVEVDQLFNGSIPAYCCMQIIGSDAKYRTHVAATAAIACAEEGLKVLCIDTCNQMVPMLFKRILDARVEAACQRNDEARQEERSNCIISRLHFKQLFDIWALMDFLCELKDAPEAQKYDVVIIDCIHHTIAPYLTEKESSGASYSRFGRTLSTRQYTMTRFTSTTAGLSSDPKNAKDKDFRQSTSIAIDTPAFEPIVTQLGLLLKSLAKGSTTVFVTNACSSRYSYHSRFMSISTC